MSVSGDFSPWAKEFPVDRLPAIFSVVLDQWPKFKRPKDRRKLENRITNRFVGHLQRTVKGKYPFNFRFRSKLADPEADAESGELDIEVFTGLDTAVYFAFECKRLHTSPGQTRTTEYVGSGGMGCFVSGQYDGNASCGGMIGYVMDSDIEAALTEIDTAIQTHSKSLNIQKPKKLHLTEICPHLDRVKQTRHQVKRKHFLIYHLLLPLN